MKINLRSRIVWPVLSSVVLCVTALSWTAYYQHRKTLEREIVNGLEQICATAVSSAEDWIFSQHRDIIHWAGLPILKAACLEDASRPQAIAQANSELARTAQLYSFYEGIHLADREGVLIASSHQEQVGKNVKDRQYYAEALKGKTAISEMLPSRASGKPIVVLSAPVLIEGQVKGLVIGALSLESFSATFVDPVKVLATGYLSAYDQNGIMLAHPVKSNIMKLDLKSYDWGKEMLQGEGGYIEYTFSGIHRIGVFKKSPKLGWGFLGTAPMADLRAGAVRAGYISMALAAGALVIIVVVLLLLVRSIVRPLETVIQDLTEGGAQIAQAAGQVSAASQGLAEGANEQAASLEETSASLEEMSSMTKQNAQNTEKAKELARSARSAADAGASEMQAMAQAMQEIQSSSDEIAKIIKTIDEIAFQTNILALNAAVEAARAGEAGMGFAVVADEVRSLAQRSAQSARETALKIEGAISKTARGAQISDNVLKTLQEIVDKVRQVDELVAEVAAASKEQSQGIEQVNGAVMQMDRTTQSNAASAEESAGAAQELKSQSGTLNSMVTQLIELVHGHQAVRQAPGNSMPSSAAPTVAVPARLNKPTPTSPVRSVPSKGTHRSELNGSNSSSPSASAAFDSRKAIPLEDSFKDF